MVSTFQTGMLSGILARKYTVLAINITKFFRLLPQNHFCIDLKKGGLVCNSCPAGESGHLHLSRGTLKQLQWINSGDLAKARRMRFSAHSLAEATAFLEAFVPYHIGKKPKSLRFLKQVRT